MKLRHGVGVAMVVGVVLACSSEQSEPGPVENGAGEHPVAGAGTNDPAGGHGGSVNGGGSQGGAASGGTAGEWNGSAGEGGGAIGEAGAGGSDREFGGAGGAGGGEFGGAGGGEDGGAPGGGAIPARRTWDGTLPNTGVCSVHGWCWAGPVPVGNAMNDVWGTSASDVWAVGEAGTVMHFDGAGWKGVTGVGDGPDYLQQQSGNFGARLLRVHGSAPNDVWFIGETKQVLHWNGTTLQVGAYSGSLTPRAVWARSSQDAWLVGDAGSVSRWNGSAWADGSSGTSQNLRAVWGFASDDVLVAGGSVVRHWNGSAWEDRSAGLPGDAALVAIWGASPTDLWAVGKTAFHYVAGSWTVPSNAAGPFVDVAGASANKVLFLSPHDDSQAYLGNNTLSFAYDGGCERRSGTWAVASDDFFVAAQSDYTAVAPEDLWCVLGRGGLDANNPVAPVSHGAWGSIYAVDSSKLLSVAAGTLRQLNGTAFVAIDTKVANVVTVSGRDPSDIWVSTSNGKTSHFNGSSWTVFDISNAPIGQVAAGQDAASPRTSAGKILYRFDGQAWSPEHTFSQSISSIAVAAASVWVATWDGAVWQGSGDDWTQILGAYTGNKFLSLNKVGLDASGRLWRGLTIQQALGTFVSYWDGEWHESINVEFANDIDVRGDEVWTLSEVGPTYRFDGAQWSPYRTGADGVHSTISIAGRGDVWLAGEASMLHYTDL
jgi:hypothetical protein